MKYHIYKKPGFWFISYRGRVCTIDRINDKPDIKYLTKIWDSICAELSVQEFPKKFLGKNFG